MLPVLLRLGFWQLERAEQKHQLQAELDRQRHLPALTADQLFTQSNTRYRRIELHGVLDNDHSWLLDNKIRQGQVGYEVISPLQLPSGETVLLNRGWLPAPRLRSELPGIPNIARPIHVTGFLHQPSDNPMVREQDGDEGWPRRIQQIDIAVLYQQLGLEPSLPFLLRLDDSSDGALVTQWQWLNNSPAKHQGYAVQWFSMAIVLVVALVFANSNLGQMIFQHNNKKRTAQ
ncbi:SURF1 family protein [Candidatus Pelagadaptatus aseana]|uniref:SURF1 family protein n=1 Tax=Candidatus Pelagadaptatus aseana TaxID=3120508 RepID=UPI003C6F6842